MFGPIDDVQRGNKDQVDKTHQFLGFENQIGNLHQSKGKKRDIIHTFPCKTFYYRLC